jgi:hypothetical protein
MGPEVSSGSFRVLVAAALLVVSCAGSIAYAGVGRKRSTSVDSSATGTKTRDRVSMLNEAQQDSSQPTPDPTDVWRGVFKGSGAIVATDGLLSQTFPAPPLVHSDWIAARERVHIYGRTNSYGMGLAFDSVGPSGDHVVAVQITAPMPGGIVSYTFRLANQIGWLSLQPQDFESALSQDGKYRVEIGRPDPGSVWRVTVTRLAPVEPDAELESAEVTIRTDRLQPPWKELDLAVSATGDIGSINGNIRLVRQ